MEIPQAFKDQYDCTEVEQVKKDKKTGIYTIIMRNGDKVKFVDSGPMVHFQKETSMAAREQYTLRNDGEWRTDVSLIFTPTKIEYEFIKRKANQLGITIKEFLQVTLTMAVSIEIKEDQNEKA